MLSLQESLINNTNGILTYAFSSIYLGFFGVTRMVQKLLSVLKSMGITSLKNESIREVQDIIIIIILNSPSVKYYFDVGTFVFLNLVFAYLELFLCIFLIQSNYFCLFFFWFPPEVWLSSPIILVTWHIFSKQLIQWMNNFYLLITYAYLTNVFTQLSLNWSPG